MECDVLVAGGGSAGLAAAVSAARTGARVVLLERNGFLGGMGTAALVHTLCGLYVVREDEVVEAANAGFAMEVAGRLLAKGGARGPVRMGRVQVLLHDPWALALLADEMVSEWERLTVLLHTELVGVAGDDRGWEVSGISRGKKVSVRAKALVDATGDALLVSLAGAPWSRVEGVRLQRPAYIVKLAGVDAAALGESGRLRLAHGIAFGVKEGSLPKESLGVGVRAGARTGECFLTLDLAAGEEGYDPLDVRLLTNMEQLGRRTVGMLVDWLRLRQVGFEHAWVAAWPTRAGVRESRRMEGLYELSLEDVLEGRRFEDGIARIAWPVELREKATGPRWLFPKCGAVGEVPLRSLRSAKFESLFAAGRCLSASHDALASVRVMGTCMATGEAAGLAAAMWAEKGMVEVEWLKACLTQRREVTRG